MKTLRTFLIFCLLLANPLAAQNKGMLLQSSLWENGNNNNLLQNGGIAFTPEVYNRADPTVIGFWMRRDVDNNVINNAPNDSAGSVVSFAVGDVNDLRANIPAQDPALPDDERWHYVFISFDGQGGYRYNVDGVQILGQNNANLFLDFLSFGAISYHDADSGELIFKGPTQYTSIIDEIMVWDSIDQGVLDIQENIYKYGMDAFDPNHPNLVAYYNCNSTANSLEYYEDVAYQGGDGDNRIYTASEETPNLIDVADKPKNFVIVTVNSEYGGERLTPKVSESGDFRYQSNLEVPTSFRAPQYVYLDRFGNELGTSDDDTSAFIDQAFYRAVNKGYSLQGGNIDLGGDNSFEELIQDDLTVTWIWELEYAVILEMAIGTAEGLTTASGNASTEVGSENEIGLGKKWASANELVSTFIDGIVPAANDPTSNTRFVAAGVIMENAPADPFSTDPDNYCAVFRRDGGFLNGGNTGVDLSDTSFTIEFWSRLDPSDADSDQNIISFGDATEPGEQLRIGFRSNSSGNDFYLANNQSGTEVDDPEYIDNDWHHWAVVYDDVADLVYIYRDGKLIRGPVSRDFDFSPEAGNADFLAIGARAASADGATYSNEFNGSLDNIRIWTTTREKSEIAESMERSQAYGSTSELALELTFDIPAVTGLLSTDGSATSFDYQDADLLLPTGNTLTDTEKAALLFNGYGSNFYSNASARVGVEGVPVTDWIRIQWQWEVQHKIELIANVPALQELIFIDTESDSFDGLEARTRWVTRFEDINIGSKYRSSDRCFTFTNIQGNQDFTVPTMLDGLRDGAVTREQEIIEVVEPETIIFDFQRTIFRAEIPLGEGLFVDTDLVADLESQLVPNLCDGGSLHLTAGTPSTIFANADLAALTNGGSVGDSGRQFIWDAVGRQLLPLIPGTYQVEWPDANGNGSYLIEIVADFPTLTRGIGHQRENDDGSRQRANDDYVYETTFDPVTESFPASPTAHYRHLYSSDTNRQPPVELDPSPADRWSFDEMTYSTGSVAVNTQANTFSAETSAKTVLLYNYAPNPTDVASGDPATEAYAVRIVDSRAMENASINYDNDELGEEERLALYANEVDQIFSRPATNGPDTAITDTPHSWEFWAKLDAEPADEELDRVAFEVEQETLAQITQVGFRGPDHPTTPNALFVDYLICGTLVEEPIDQAGLALNGSLEGVSRILGNDPDAYLELLDIFGEGTDQGALVLDDIAGGAEITDLLVAAEVSLRPGEGGGPGPGPSEGLSFSFAPDLSGSAFGASGVGTGLTLRFDVDQNKIELLYNNTVLATDNSGGFVSAGPDHEFKPLLIKLETDGTVDVTFDGAQIFNNVATTFAGATGWRLGFGASSFFGENEFAIDSLRFVYNKTATPQLVETVQPEGIFIDDSWHHYVVRKDSATVSLFIDGRMVESSAFGSPTITNETGNKLTIGYSPTENGNWLNGCIDGFGRWNSAMTIEEVRDAFFHSRPDDTNGGDWWLLGFDYPNLATVQATTADGSTRDFQVVDASSGSVLSTAADGLVIQSADFFAEVASRIISKYDTAGFGSGFLLNESSNYNASIYNRNSAVGTWGAIFPVNWSGLYASDSNELGAIYYENPFTVSPFTTTTLHPNVAWPYSVVTYETVEFPSLGEHKDKRIFVASRLGTEGVDANGDDQLVIDPAIYENFEIYNQPSKLLPGYNPNEEHASIHSSIKAFLTGDNSFDFGQDSAFAMQRNLNIWGENDDDGNTTANQADDFTSEPWVLIQYQNSSTEEWHMAAYEVLGTRSGNSLFPALDSVTNEPIDSFGQPVAQPNNPTYDFEYPTFAGNLHLPPYPLNRLIGVAQFDEDAYGNLTIGGNEQRTLWFDINNIAWVVSGDGRYYYRHHYPLPNEFWYDLDDNGTTDIPIGDPVPHFVSADGTLAQHSKYNSYWKTDYPTLKRGESLTYQGGEFAAENPGADGLPAVVGWAAGQVVYDNASPSMEFETLSDLDTYTARLVRPLDRIEVDFDQADFPQVSPNLTPANTEAIQVVAERWYFKGLTGSLQKRLYYDTLTQKLVFRGRINDLESGDPDLTTVPISLYVLEPNYMTKAEYDGIFTALEISDSDPIGEAIAAIFLEAQNPNGVIDNDDDSNPANDTTPTYLPGVEMTANQATQSRIVPHLTEELDGSIDDSAITDPTAGDYVHLQSLGSGTALIPNPSLLEQLDTDPGPYYITLAENNHPDAGGAITIHVIQIGTERMRGAIKLIEAANVFDEKINLQHNADFGGNTEDIYYEWWYREVDSLQNVGLPGADSKWLPYEKGLGLHKIEFSGNPTVMLSDNLFYVRYGHKGDFTLSEINGGSVTDDDWRLVDINNDSDTYVGGSGSPFQWAGASNSPQLQADGSFKFIPQLVMGWVKRVLDRVNPYEARYTDFFNNESPATYSSQIQIAGKPFIGKVALNADKDVIENVGLIELYETILARAKELSLELGTSSPGINQAILLAATRLSFLYELLGKEAYSDAQDSTITVSGENGLAEVAPYVHSFTNQEASLLHEELALLRGTDFVKAYPSFNRLFWNYVKGEGEAAYNANYNIYDVNEDGFINEFDAAELYPQGHGDSWGHLVSANKMHYELLRNNVFDWEARAELYSLLDNVIETDYLDEKTFARVAAAKARAGDDIVRGTYRLSYTEDPDGQWQGYTDTANPARAWGVSEWGKRAGQGAYFDWIAANLVAPHEDSSGENENLDRIDRRTNQLEISEVASSLLSVQRTVDEANSGFNPIGLDKDAVVFDIDPVEYTGVGGSRNTHFEQAYNKAVAAAQNAIATFEYSSDVNQSLRRVADDTLTLQAEALRQDLDYRNRLIEIFGQPYSGNIGPGQIYAEGYEGPDTLLYNYIDRLEIDDYLISEPADRIQTLETRYNNWTSDYSDLDWNGNYASNSTDIDQLFDEYYLTRDFGSLDLGDGLSVEAPVETSSEFGFQVPDADDDGVPDWGSRPSYGELQMILNEMVAEQIALRQSTRDYAEFIEQIELLSKRLQEDMFVHENREETRSSLATIQTTLGILASVAGVVESFAQWGWDFAWQSSIVAEEYFPEVLGFSNDATAPARGAVLTVGQFARSPLLMQWTLAQFTRQGAEAGIALAEARAEHDEILGDEYQEMNNIILEVGTKLTEEEGKRLAISAHIKRLEQLAHQYQTTLSQGFRLLDEREAFNMALASKAQSNRYSDMIYRLSRNEAMSKYENSLSHALRYAWLAAKAYDYETSLDPASAGSASGVLEELVRTRSLGLWEGGQPRIGKGGLAEQLAQLKANFDSLEGQLGINNPQVETGKISLRDENYRILPESDDRWQSLLNSNKVRVDDLWTIPEFRSYCRPFADPADGAQPGLVIDFSTVIESGKNLFGRELGANDQSYSSANFATKLVSAGVWFEGYSEAGLATAPRVYLVPAGADTLRLANSSLPTKRTWNVIEQRIPVPYTLNSSDLGSSSFIPSQQATNGSFADIRRFGDFRAYSDNGDTVVDNSQLASDSRLIGRSIANSKWLLIIPGATLHADADYGIDQFIENVDDIKLVFETYSHQGQ